MDVFSCSLNVDQIQGGPHSIQAGQFLVNDGDNYTAPFIPTSYAFNEAIVGWADPPLVTGHRRCRGLMSAVPHPADTLLAADGNPRTGNDTWVVYNDANPNETMETLLIRDPDIVDRVRHYGKIGILFADWHCEDVDIPAMAATSNTAYGAVFNNISVDIGMR